MKERLESFLLVLAVGAAVAIGAKRFAIPYNVALVVVGLLLVFVDVLPHASMDPQVILIVFLPLLVFEGALFADAAALRRASRPILALAIPGVLISLLGTAAVAAFALRLPFSAAMLLGALLAITDTVSVLLAFRSVRVPPRLAAIMEGESLFNDGTALVLVSLTTTILSHGVFDLSLTLRALVVAMVGGAALGVVFGMAGAAVLRRTPDHLTAILTSLVLVLGTAALAEEANVSPVIAVVVAGLVVGTAARRALEPSRVLALFGFWETTGFAINVLLFLRIGMQLDPGMLLREGPAILLALIALHAGRAVAVYGTCFTLKLVARERIPPRWQHVMVLGNIKGALSMAAVLALPTTLPYRDRLVAIVFGATFITLVTQALPLKRWLTWLGVAESSSDERLDAARARLIAARRGHTELDELLAAGLLSRQSHAERRAAFQRQIILAEQMLRGTEASHEHDGVVDAALLYAQKAAVLDAARRGLIPSGVAEAEVEGLDRSLISLELSPHTESASDPQLPAKKGALSMRVFIAGAGQAGVSVALHLAELGHAVSVLDRDPVRARRVFEQHGLVALSGDATDAALLRQAEVGRADVAVAMLDRDADNLAVALLARDLGAKRVMVRMRDVDYRGAYEFAGVHRILSETEILVGALAMAIEHEAVNHAMLLGGGQSVAFELTIPRDAAVVDSSVSEIAAHPDFPPSCVFAALFDKTGMHSPRGASVVSAEQEVLLVCQRAEMPRVVEFFMRRR